MNLSQDIKVYAAEGKKVEDTVLPVLQNNMGIRL
jgi:hypothetical protein